MTDRSKFEQMLEHLVNEDQEAAREIFHQIVVEKSREIYENILAEDFSEAKEEDDEEMDEAKEEDDEEMDEAKEEDDEEMDESKEEDDEEMDENFAFDEADKDIGGDPTDDMLGDIEDGGDEMGDDEMGGEEDLEDRVVDLEDALDDLRAEFEKLMGGEEEGSEDEMDMDMGGDDAMDMSKGKDEMETFNANFMREYIEKVSSPKHGDNGANAKSIVAGKNDMGGTTANILNGGESTTGGTKGGLANPSTKEDNAGNVNVPGGKAGVKHLKKVSTPAGGDDGDKSAGSPLNGVKSRAK